MTPFGARLHSAVREHGPLCVGIDPHAALLREWALPETAEGLERFTAAVIDACVDRVAVVKPQIAFFERFGSAGYAVLERQLARARAAGLLVLADVKRGDIGSTVDAYGEAWLEPGSPLEADAMTAVAYQGVGSLRPVIDRAHEHGKGVFVLAATSNPEGSRLQSADTGGGVTVAATIVDELAHVNERTRVGEVWGSLGVVIGATVDLTAAGIAPAALSATPILAPGFGHQGARLEDLRSLYGDASATVLASVSRSILSAGPDGIGAAIDAHRARLSA